MKTPLTVSILFGGSLALAQITSEIPINFESNSSLRQKSFLEEKRANEKKGSFELAVPSDRADYRSIFETRQKMKSHLKAARGTEGVGGANGIQSADGKITPLDVIFIDANSKIDVRKKYPVALRYFETQVVKISNAIPSFAKDIKSIFSKLSWNLTKLDLNTQGCLNNMGIFKVRAGDKQVIIACQNSDGVVTLSKNAIKLLEKPEYLGVVFLHEVFVNRLLSFSSDDYSLVEEKMITKVMPYILSNQSLDQRTLYKYAGELGFHRDDGIRDRLNPYALEVFEERKDEHAHYQKAAEAFRAKERKGHELVQSVIGPVQTVQNLPCEGDKHVMYMAQYQDAKRVNQEILEAYKATASDLLQNDFERSQAISKAVIKFQDLQDMETAVLYTLPLLCQAQLNR